MNHNSPELRLIRRFEREVFQRRHNQAVPLLHKIAVEAERSLMGDAAEDREFRERMYTRLAAAVVALFSDPLLPINLPTYYQLSMVTRALEALFRQTPYHNLDHVLSIAGALNGRAEFDRAAIKSRPQRVQLMLSRTLTSRVRIDPSELFAVSPHMAAVTGVNCLAGRAILSAESDAEKRRWLDAAPRFATAGLPMRTDFLSRFSAAWMMCSYIDADNKHDFKESTNIALREEMVKSGLRYVQDLPPRQVNARPKLCVVIEIMHARHAMFRCHARELQALRKKFHLTLVINGPNPSQEVRDLFHDEILFDTSMREFTQVVHEVAARKFDLIYYPSVGMRYWAVLMANLRLAPIQFFSIGHPATTRSPFMDYIIMYAGYLGEASALSERVVLLPDEALCYDPPANAGRIEPKINDRADLVRVAVPSKVFKLTMSFMERCCRIRDACGRKIEFHFFPNERSDLFHFDITDEIDKWLPGSVVHRTTTYEKYIELLNECDVSFSPFPFGGINSTVDCLRQGIPVVTQLGPEPHSRLDSLPMRLMGLPEWLLAADEADYERAALRLIRNDEERAAIGRQLVSRDVDQVLFGQQSPELADVFADVVWSLYQHHEDVMEDPRRVWSYEDLSEEFGFNSGTLDPEWPPTSVQK